MGYIWVIYWLYMGYTPLKWDAHPSRHTGDGCEILHQLVDGLTRDNPVLYCVSSLPIINPII